MPHYAMACKTSEHLASQPEVTTHEHSVKILQYINNKCIFCLFSLLFLLNLIQLDYEMHLQSFERLHYVAVEICLKWGKMMIH